MRSSFEVSYRDCRYFAQEKLECLSVVGEVTRSSSLFLLANNIIDPIPWIITDFAIWFAPILTFWEAIRAAMPAENKG